MSSSFSYGPDLELIQQVESGSGGSALRTYVDSLYEKALIGTSSTEEKFYIRAGDALVAIRTVTNGGAPATRYVHRDHLGSTDVLTDSFGNPLKRESFDTWGRRRNPTWTDPTPGQFGFDGGVGLSITAGFTGHVAVDHLELVHMGGRVYDPVLGRFLSPDPFVTVPLSSQGYNRYTYVANNPLSLTDPSGHGFWSFLGDWWKGFWGWVGRFLRDYLGPIVGFTIGLFIPALWALVPFISSGVQIAINGGSVKDILFGAAIGGFTAMAMGGVMATTMLGDVISSAWTYLVTSPVANAIGVAGTALFGPTAMRMLGAVTGVTAFSRAADNPLMQGSILGKLWNLPNTAVGLAIGGTGMLVGGIASGVSAATRILSFGYFGAFQWYGGSISAAGNAIVFENNPLMKIGGGGGITFGNVVNLSGAQDDPAATWDTARTRKTIDIIKHEIQHTFQGEVLGPLYIPANVVGMSASVATAPFGYYGAADDWFHNRFNFMEYGPQKAVPTPWPW